VPLPAGDVRVAEEHEIAEEVLRWLIVDLAKRPNWHVYVKTVCVGVREKDPSARLIANLPRRGGAMVKARSECAWSEAHGHMVDKTNSAQAISLDVDKITWQSGDRVSAIGEYSEASLSAGGYTFQLVREKPGWWRVRSARMDWIS
jgi:hypothetical protein